MVKTNDDMEVESARANDYYNRAFKLGRLFGDNIKSAEAEIIVEDSPVDYADYRFIFSVYRCDYISLYLRGNFSMIHHLFKRVSGMNAEYIAGLDQDENYVALSEYFREWIKEFHSLEEQLASQNEYLDKLISMKTETA